MVNEVFNVGRTVGLPLEALKVAAVWNSLDVPGRAITKGEIWERAEKLGKLDHFYTTEPYLRLLPREET